MSVYEKPDRKSYSDADGNTYRVERASNGMSVCVRINSGMNRKMFRQIDPQRSELPVQHSLDVVAAEKGWREVK